MFPLALQNKNVLLGDSAHAIVPFYGQGMNASFEDVTVFDSIIEQYEGDWETIFKVYEKTRKADTDAIADLAIDNYYEMRDHVANPIFKEKRAIEMALEKEFPNDYFSKYSMVTFKEDIPYHTAMTKGRAQDKAILNLLADKKINTTDNLSSIFKQVKEETEAILQDDRVAGLK